MLICLSIYLTNMVFNLADDILWRKYYKQFILLSQLYNYRYFDLRFIKFKPLDSIIFMILLG